MNKAVLKYLIGLTSFLLAGIAAYFSITGLAKLFAGTGSAILIMASALEFSKLLSVSYLYRFWKTISNFIKIYLLIAVVILMMITSLGIYGFLTAGYQSTKNQFDISNTSIISLQNKKSSVDSKIQYINSSVESYKDRLTTLSTQRNNTEKRIDKSFDLNKFTVSNKQNTNAKEIDAEIKLVNSKIEELQNAKLILSDSSDLLNLSITQTKLKNENSTELGPLVYVSNITGISLDIIVNVLIMLFIFVFDPLAVVLLVVFNSLSIEEPSIAENKIQQETEQKTIENNIEQNNESAEVINDEVKEEPIQENIVHHHHNIPRMYVDSR